MLLTLKDGLLVRTKKFVVDRWYSIEGYSFLGADEIVCIDVGKPPNRGATARTVGRILSEAFIPVTIGGSMRSLSDVRWAFDNGADKILTSDYDLVTEIAAAYGRQAVVQGVTKGLVEAVRRNPEAGEYLVQDVAFDGSLAGYNYDLLDESERPLVIGSGCGNADHMIEAFRAGADGCATSCILHFSETTLLNFKRRIQAAGFKVRM